LQEFLKHAVNPVNNHFPSQLELAAFPSIFTLQWRVVADVLFNSNADNYSQDLVLLSITI